MLWTLQKLYKPKAFILTWKSLRPFVTCSSHSCSEDKIILNWNLSTSIVTLHEGWWMRIVTFTLLNDIRKNDQKNILNFFPIFLTFKLRDHFFYPKIKVGNSGKISFFLINKIHFAFSRSVSIKMIYLHHCSF